jgi:Zn-dependent peptidase ImmA (M78 family)
MNACGGRTTVDLRRGFKTEANDIAREIRQELRLAPTERLNPWTLARHLEIPVEPLGLMTEDVAFAVAHFTVGDPSAFSAVTVFCGLARRIVHNDAHSLERQASNLAHELSHALLLHPPTPALDDRGCRDWDPELENEATWLGGALLVSEEAALLVVRQGLSLQAAAQRYRVSEPMMRFRLNVTGAHARVARARRV